MTSIDDICSVAVSNYAGRTYSSESEALSDLHAIIKSAALKYADERIGVLVYTADKMADVTTDHRRKLWREAKNKIKQE